MERNGNRTRQNGYAGNAIDDILEQQRRFHDMILNYANAVNWSNAAYNNLRDELEVMRIELAMLLRPDN